MDEPVEQDGLITMYQPFEESLREVEKIHPSRFSRGRYHHLAGTIFMMDFAIRVALVTIAVSASITISSTACAFSFVIGILHILMLSLNLCFSGISADFEHNISKYAIFHSKISTQIRDLCKKYSDHSFNDIRDRDRHFVTQIRKRFGWVLHDNEFIRMLAAVSYREE